MPSPLFRSALAEPADQPYGDRVAGVSDGFGSTWYLATGITEEPVQNLMSDTKRTVNPPARRFIFDALYLDDRPVRTD